MMPMYGFVDLDDTLFQTAKKCSPGEELVPAALDREGRPLSFMTRRQQALFQWLASSATLIPTTARNSGAFGRVLLPWSHRAILDYGAVVLREDHTPDPAWHGRMDEALAPYEAALGRIHGEMTALAAREVLAVRGRVIEDFGLTLYVVFKNVDPASGDLARLHRRVREEGMATGYSLFFNDNNLAVVPSCLDKRLAVAYVLEEVRRAEGEPLLAFGMGDSLSDVPYLAGLDFALVPGGSQIMTSLREALHV